MGRSVILHEVDGHLSLGVCLSRGAAAFVVDRGTDWVQVGNHPGCFVQYRAFADRPGIVVVHLIDRGGKLTTCAREYAGHVRALQSLLG